jgi:hypothetical protein
MNALIMILNKVDHGHIMELDFNAVASRTLMKPPEAVATVRIYIAHYML